MEQPVETWSDMSDKQKQDEPLDIDAWIDGAEPPEGEIEISSKGKAHVQLERLKQRRLQAQLASRSSGRMVPVDVPDDIDEQITRLEATVQSGVRTFRLQAVDGERWREIMREHGKEEGSRVDEYLVAECLVDPRLDHAGVVRLRKAIREGQFMRLAKACNSVSFDAEPSLDF